MTPKPLLPRKTLSPNALAQNLATHRRRPKGKNWTGTNKIKYDSELLLKYLYEGFGADKSQSNINVIKVYKVKVKKTGASILAHYFAHVSTSTGYEFEFHPGSQPRTFQTVHTDGLIIKVHIMCNECCKSELRRYVEGENGFNVAFRNCESILCRRVSFQTLLLGSAILLLLFNVENFSMLNLFVILLILLALFCHNNYIISNPQVVFCNHKNTLKNHE
nr:HycuOrf-70 hypothetical protein [Hyphantria cunea nucleopolyhedrovirus]UIX56343.1 HycuOrf-70 hypothetical protein [Hyphantria cunea nucleopolyhedrovirus]